ncbi:amidohydrolase family protein [Trichococcus collinsii]|uniref:Predicted metal-dependent hydrolase, TIM-barrel fold n=1 Tax=Trichococcus collinsii TaxID=157076 RepID=A0AB38A279_9LACT|nr:amidohydrolase family protein [Trichococcus collinsii]CZR06035.1 amidohydrolase 2 [Trichococcus collinsii]SEA73568.1 Predicted metal-dependent hydrolase, TIM-barrel fold [Trichococcus collinsii]
MDIFDAHFHIIDPKFPLFANEGFLPDPYRFSDYEASLTSLDINCIGGAIVSGSFQGYDQSYLIETLKNIPDSFVGVAQVPADISDMELAYLNEQRVRAVRFNLFRGMAGQNFDKMLLLSKRVFENFGWHTEIYMDARKIEEFYPFLSRIPKLVIDHLGMNKVESDKMRLLLENGTIFKATGFGRINMDPIPVMKEMLSFNPGSVIFGTDLPGTRARRPILRSDIELIESNFTEKETQLIFKETAEKLYLHR